MQVVMAVRAAGSDAVAVPGDVSDTAATAEVFDTVEHALGSIRAPVCNAGVDREAAVADATEEDIRRIVAINALGPIWCARETVRRMSTVRGGSGGVIVNVPSLLRSSADFPETSSTPQARVRSTPSPAACTRRPYSMRPNGSHSAQASGRASGFPAVPPLLELCALKGARFA